MAKRKKASYLPKSEEAKKRVLDTLAKGRETQKKMRQAGFEPNKGLIAPDARIYEEDIVLWAQEQYMLKSGPIRLESWQIEGILKPLYSRNSSGHRKYTQGLILMPKKNGKSELASLVALFTATSPRTPEGSEIYVCASDRAQSGRVVFKRISDAIRRNRLLNKMFLVTTTKVTNKKTGTFIEILETGGTTSGLSPLLIIWDELWQFESDLLQQHYEELCEVPNVEEPMQLIITYPGPSEDSLLYRLYKQAKSGVDKEFFFYHTHENKASWVTQKYLDSQRLRLRETTYLRLHEARWAGAASQFVTPGAVDAITDRQLVRAPAARRNAHIGVDIGVRNDYAALAVIGYDQAGAEGKFELIDHRLFKPEDYPDHVVPLIEVEDAIKEFAQEYFIQSIRYDPSQFERSAQVLAELIACEFVRLNQTSGQLTTLASQLYQHIQAKTLKIYPSPEVREHLLHCQAVETARGWKLSKLSGSKKIDLAAAISFALDGCINEVEGGTMTVEELQDSICICPDYRSAYKRW